MEEKQKKKGKLEKVLLICGVTLSLVGFIIIIINLIINISTRHVEIKASDLVFNTVKVGKEVPEVGGEEILVVDNGVTESLRKEFSNEDIVGYLEFPRVGIKYPITQYKDNSYYLNHSIYKNYSTLGSLFLDYECSNGFSDGMTAIYGHYSSNGMMFGSLESSLMGNLDGNVYFYIYSGNYKYTYRCVSEFFLSSNERNFLLGEGYDADTYREALKERGKYYGTGEESRFLSLVTCNKKGTSRYCVVGGLVKIEEVEVNAD